MRYVWSIKVTNRELRCVGVDKKLVFGKINIFLGRKYTALCAFFEGCFKLEASQYCEYY